MAVQVVPQMGGLAEALGQGLGGGFSQSVQAGLPQLLDYKIAQILKPQKQAQNLAFAQALGLASGMPQAGGELPLQNAIQQGLEGMPESQLQNKALMGGGPAASMQGIDFSQFTPEQQMKLAQAQQGERRVSARERTAAAQEAKTGIQERRLSEETNKALNERLDTVARQAPITLAELKRLEDLNKSGQIQYRWIGPTFESLRNPATQEFVKTTNNIISRAVQSGNITNKQAKILQDSMLSLMNSPEGAERILHALKNIEKLGILDVEGRRKVRAKHGGMLPANAYDEILQATADKREKLLEKIEMGLDPVIKKMLPDPKNVAKGKIASYGGNIYYRPPEKAKWKKLNIGKKNKKSVTVNGKTFVINEEGEWQPQQ